MPSPTQSLFRQIVRISYVYLGPAADRFVTRQIVNHLQKQPDKLQSGDLPELIDWIRLAMGFLTEDQAIVNAYIARLQALQRKVKPGKAINKSDSAHATKTS
jgi:hypothetical protein